MKGLSRREVLGYFLNERGLTGKGVEVGSAWGGYARTILDAWKGEQLFLVDPWEKQDNSVYQENTNTMADFNDWYQNCKNLAAQDKRVVLVKKYSVDAASIFDKESLDFVYIDGNHSYRNVMEDMDAWFPKVKIGGVFGGHDFQNKTDEGWFCEVENAVKRWTNEHDFPFVITPCSSWWLEKTHP